MKTAQIVALCIFASMLGAVAIWALIGFVQICWRACRKEKALSAQKAKEAEAGGTSAV